MTLTQEQIDSIQEHNLKMLREHYLPEGSPVTIITLDKSDRCLVVVSKTVKHYVYHKDELGRLDYETVEHPTAVDITHLVAHTLGYRESKTTGAIMGYGYDDLAKSISQKLYGRDDALLSFR